jgi:outer membrane receptor protein involved in Fe transport
VLRLCGLLLWLLLAAAPIGLRAQAPEETGVITGTVMEAGLDRPLAEVTVTIRGLTLGTTTDAAGRYTLRLVPPGDHILVFSRRGYQRGTVADVRVAAGQTTTADAQLKPEYYEMDLFEVIAEPYEESAVQILQDRQEAAALVDALGADFIARVGAWDAAEAVSKVTGTTIVAGKFAVVRGLADRYTIAMLNGGEIPSADPYRKAAQLDQFPAGMIERIEVSKTFTPDQPGGFTGGAINIVSRSFPEAFAFTTQVGVGYNTAATLQDGFLTTKGGSTDWLGMDDGYRALPAALDDVDYTQLFPGVPGVRADSLDSVPEVFRVADVGAANALLFAQRYVALSRAFDNTRLGPEESRAPVNHNFNLSFGDTQPVLGRRLGYYAGLNYERRYFLYEGTQARWLFPIIPPGEPPGLAQPRVDVTDVRGVEEIIWGATVNLAYELNENHELGFVFLYTRNTENLGRLRVGPASTDNFGRDQISYLNEAHWTERALQGFQLKGRHDLPDLAGIRLDWLASLSDTTQDEPDYRLFNFSANPGGSLDLAGSSGAPEPAGGPTRYFRELAENNLTLKGDLTAPFSFWGGLESRLKAGAFHSQSERTFRERTFTYLAGGAGGDPLTLPERFLSYDGPGFSEFRNPRGGLVGYQIQQPFTDALVGNSRYRGEQEIQALYTMLELPVWERFTLIGGVRYETTDLTAESLVAGANISVNTNTAIRQRDWLPAAGFKWEVITNMNLRFNFAQTLARPTFREFSGLRSYDVTGDEIFVGNPSLRMSAVDNWDLRWEWFRRPGEVLSASVFYKDITRPIERIALDGFKGDEISYTNFPSARVFGFEVEARSSLDVLDELLADFNLGVNFAWIESEVRNVPRIIESKALVGVDGRTRPLFDQSPYVINADLTYANQRLGTTVTLAYSVFGERLYLVNNGGYDVYEQPAAQLDLVLRQRFSKHWRLQFGIRNLLDPVVERTYGRDGEVPHPLAPYSSFRRGRIFSFALGYDY